MIKERLITESDIFMHENFCKWLESGEISYEKNQEGLNELKLNIGNYKMYLSNNGVIGGKIINGEREIKDIYEIKVLNPNEINETQKWIEHILFQLTLTKEDVTQIIGKILKVI